VTDPFANLEQAIRSGLARHLPAGARITDVQLGERELIIEARKSFFSVTLTARVVRSPDAVRLDYFALRGAFGLGGDEMREAIATVNESWPPFHARGVDGGDAVVITRV
jgi:hypothetical protein